MSHLDLNEYKKRGLLPKEKISITIRCIGCGAVKIVDENQKDMPFCDKCGSVMLAQKAEIKKKMSNV